MPDWALAASDLGLTDSIRMLLQSYPNRLFGPTEVRDVLVAGNYDFGQQPNPLASIHTVLKRITNGVDPRYVRVEGEKGTLYKFDSPAAARAYGHPAAGYRQGPPPMPRVEQQAPPQMPPMPRMQEQAPPPMPAIDKDTSVKDFMKDIGKLPAKVAAQRLSEFQKMQKGKK